MHFAGVSSLEPLHEALLVLGQINARDPHGVETEFDGDALNIGGQRVELCGREFHGGAV